ncbi:hypothetical protein KIPB_006408 [Kipferlia bialata]|uniref:Lipid-binding serum glycoprotein N-terminal domain-containing protein n=1 Tax=Kipferlia bialata TaxID=797122 RepID=A0A9K3GJ85_9EUKA|nr:hypothetical protein KIPB_006408 [Kipferlia bialata]|eukprot:g6408.t1
MGEGRRGGYVRGGGYGGGYRTRLTSLFSPSPHLDTHALQHHVTEVLISPWNVRRPAVAGTTLVLTSGELSRSPLVEGVPLFVSACDDRGGTNVLDPRHNQTPPLAINAVVLYKVNMIVAFSTEGLNGMATGTVPTIEQWVQQMKFPDIDTPLDLKITTVDLSISDLTCVDMNIEGLTLQTDTDGETPLLIMNLADTSLDLSFEWGYVEQGFPFLEGSGTGSAAVTGMAGSVSTTLDVDPVCGQMFATFQSFSFDFGDISITLNGGDDTLLNSLIGLVEDLFASRLSDMVGAAMEAGTNARLQGYNWENNLGTGVTMDTRWGEMVIIWMICSS